MKRTEKIGGASCSKIQIAKDVILILHRRANSIPEGKLDDE